MNAALRGAGSRTTRLLRLVRAAALPALVAMTACERSPTPPPVDPGDAAPPSPPTPPSAPVPLLRDGVRPAPTQPVRPGDGPFLTAGDVFDLTDGLTPDDAAQALVGPGITLSNVTYTGVPEALGTFADGSAVGIESGIILSSGWVKDVVGPNESRHTSRANGTPGDPDLDALSGFETLDAAVLEFDFDVPVAAERITLRYVFGSDEYNLFVGMEFNDVFAFFVNGENCATVGGAPVSINAINNGANPNHGGEVVMPTNPELYVNNDPFDPDITGSPLPAAPHHTEMDGFTVVLTCEAEVMGGSTNTMKIAIADASDRHHDSWVLLEAGSLTLVPLAVHKHWSQTDVCFLQGGDPAQECPAGTSLGTPLPVDAAGFATIRAVVAGGTIRSYDPGQVYAVSTLHVVSDVPGVEIREAYGDCTHAILDLNPPPGEGGGSVVVVVLDGQGEPVQVLDATSPGVTVSDDEATVILGPQAAGTTVLVYVKFGPGLRGQPYPGPLTCENLTEAQAGDADGPFGDPVAATAGLALD